MRAIGSLYMEPWRGSGEAQPEDCVCGDMASLSALKYWACGWPPTGATGALGWVAVLSFRLRMQRKKTAAMLAPINARPPTTPPTMAPIGVDFDLAVGVGVGGAIGIVVLVVPLVVAMYWSVPRRPGTPHQKYSWAEVAPRDAYRRSEEQKASVKEELTLPVSKESCIRLQSPVDPGPTTDVPRQAVANGQSVYCSSQHCQKLPDVDTVEPYGQNVVIHDVDAPMTAE